MFYPYGRCRYSLVYFRRYIYFIILELHIAAVKFAWNASLFYSLLHFSSSSAFGSGALSIYVLCSALLHPVVPYINRCHYSVTHTHTLLFAPSLCRSYYTSFHTRSTRSSWTFFYLALSLSFYAPIFFSFSKKNYSCKLVKRIVCRIWFTSGATSIWKSFILDPTFSVVRLTQLQNSFLFNFLIFAFNQNNNN